MNSVLAQTYPIWRAYCVDDGSSDDTPSILDAYAKKDERIRVFHIQNQGAAGARNYALSQLQDEEWISFVDADDYIAPTMYETIMDAIGCNEVDYVRLFCQHTPLRYDGRKYDASQQPAVKFRIVTQEEYFMKENVGGYTSNLFLNRNTLLVHPLQFPTTMKILEDQAFSISCATYSKHFMIMEEPRNYFYYSNNANSLTKQSHDNSNDIIRCVNIVYRQFSQCCSQEIMDHYFYAKYLPSKLDTLYSHLMRSRGKTVTEKLDSRIKVRFFSLSGRTQIKYLLAKLLCDEKDI